MDRERSRSPRKINIPLSFEELTKKQNMTLSERRGHSLGKYVFFLDSKDTDDNYYDYYRVPEYDKPFAKLFNLPDWRNVKAVFVFGLVSQVKGPTRGVPLDHMIIQVGWPIKEQNMVIPINIPIFEVEGTFFDTDDRWYKQPGLKEKYTKEKDKQKYVIENKKLDVWYAQRRRRTRRTRKTMPSRNKRSRKRRRSRSSRKRRRV